MAERPTDNAPLITVLMPVYNAAPFVAAAITSILEQTFTDFELIIVNDGSTDGSSAVISAFLDPRIRTITQVNQGISAALNTGLALARGEFIARQDADDLSLPERLEKQVAYLRAHPDVGLLGTWATIIDKEGVQLDTLEHATDDDGIRFALLFDTPFVHASAMFRKSLINEIGGYDPDTAIFEDHNLWSRMIQSTRGANIPEHLMKYRLVDSGLMQSTTQRIERIRTQRLRNLSMAFPNASVELLNDLSEFTLRHARITTSRFRAVFSALSEHVARTCRDPLAAKHLHDRVRNGMLGYHIIARPTHIHAAVDRLLKEILLLSSAGLRDATNSRKAHVR